MTSDLADSKNSFSISFQQRRKIDLMIESGHGSGKPEARSTVGRRQMLCTVGAAIVVGGTGVVWVDDAAAAESTRRTRTVWRLDPDWGYPRGPHGKTRLNSRASRSAAQHRYALTRQDAERMNLHLCSFAPAIPVVVDADAFDELWTGLSHQWTSPRSGITVRLLDDRQVGRLVDGDETLRIALGAQDQAIERTHTAGPGVESNRAPEATSSQDPGSAPTSSTTPASSAPVPTHLALTGAGVRAMVGAGAAALSAGVVMLRSRRGGDAAPPELDQPI